MLHELLDVSAAYAVKSATLLLCRRGQTHCHARQAARWRKQQRKSIAPLLGAALARDAAAAPAARSVSGSRRDEDGEEEEEGEEQQRRRGLFGGLFQQLAEPPPPSIRSRTAGILQADRSESSLDEADELP